MTDLYVVIPALEPDGRLCGYIEKLRKKTEARIVVVDDGSGREYDPLFEQIEKMEGCAVLRHGKNMGKGRALKTGFSHIRDTEDGQSRILCADSDGQHLAEDVLKISEKMRGYPDDLILGSRDFSDPSVPFRSRFGNRMTSFIFWIVCGRWLSDTQTGFRAFHSTLLDHMIEIPGERFEYETRMLADCVQKKIPIRTEPICTVYENGNEGSHFRPVRDSLSVISVLFSGILRFCASSLFCAALDLLLFWGLSQTVPDGSGILWKIALPAVISRILSAAANWLINGSLVFGSGGGAVCALKYAFLMLGMVLCSAGLTSVLWRGLGIPLTAAKVFCDTALFFVSYRIQKAWVFRPAKCE